MGDVPSKHNGRAIHRHEGEVGARQRPLGQVSGIADAPVGSTFIGVPPVVAGGPGQGGREGLEEVVEHPGDDDVVVDTADARYHHHGPAHTCTAKKHILHSMLSAT